MGGRVAVIGLLARGASLLTEWGEWGGWGEQGSLRVTHTHTLHGGVVRLSDRTAQHYVSALAF